MSLLRFLVEQVRLRINRIGVRDMEKRPLMIRRLLVSTFSLLFAATSMLATHAVAADYPAKPIRILVGFSPGGATDFATRVIEAKLTPLLGQQVIVENRTGGGGNIASEALAKANPDGYTIMMGTGAMGPAPSLYNLPFDTIKDFSPITQVAAAANILVVHPSVAATSVEELIALAKANPGELLYGSSGIGSPQHLQGELFSSMAGVSMVHVPYKGGSQAIIDLVAGRVQVSFATVATVIQYIESGQLRAIAATGAQRSDLLPNLPTVNEGGLPGFFVFDYVGLLAPAKTPRPIIDRLNADITKVLAMPDVKEALFKRGLQVAPGTPEQFGALIESEVTKWAKVINEKGIKVEQ